MRWTCTWTSRITVESLPAFSSRSPLHARSHTLSLSSHRIAIIFLWCFTLSRSYLSHHIIIQSKFLIDDFLFPLISLFNNNYKYWLVSFDGSLLFTGQHGAFQIGFWLRNVSAMRQAIQTAGFFPLVYLLVGRWLFNKSMIIQSNGKWTEAWFSSGPLRIIVVDDICTFDHFLL